MTREEARQRSIYVRKRGCLYGLAVGDALGAAVEFKMPGEFSPLTCYRDGGPFHLRRGQWTDDTSMALALADSIGKTGWNLTDQMNRYCDWWQNGTYSVNGRCFDIGTQTRYALNEFLDTNQARSGDTDEANSGNGSIMRLAPVAIKYADLFPARIEELSIIAEDSSATTHPSPQCTSACRYMALVLAALINGEEKKDVLSPDWKYLNELNEIKPLHKLVQKVAEGSFRSGKVKGSGWVIESLEAALWAFSSSSGFDQAVLKAANLGNDADTTAAVCGQFAGAYWGETGISYTPFRDELDRKDMIEEALASLGVGKHY